MATPVLNSSQAWDALLAEAHAWQYCPSELRAPAVRDRCLTLLRAEERAQYEQFRTEEMREVYLGARMLCRATLSQYTGVDPSEWRFAAGLHGKPVLVEPDRFGSLRFNLTRTAGLVICIATRAGEVGVDAEETSRPVDHSLVARHFLSRRQRARLAGLCPHERAARFFEQWVLKEAYVKATGAGLAYSPERLTVEQRDDGQPVAIGNCQFSLYRPSSKHVAAAAVLRRDDLAPVPIEWLRTRSLLGQILQS